MDGAGAGVKRGYEPTDDSNANGLLLGRLKPGPITVDDRTMSRHDQVVRGRKGLVDEKWSV